jgi:hypothetical protein
VTTETAVGVGADSDAADVGSSVSGLLCFLGGIAQIGE